jgi:outer membrane protein TolC
LWDGGRAKADRAATLARADALGHRLTEVDTAIAVEVHERLLAVASARAALEASGEAVTAAAEARRVAGERFDVGVATAFDVLDADVILLEAELERARFAATLRLSEARLLRTTGSN